MWRGLVLVSLVACGGNPGSPDGSPAPPDTPACADGDRDGDGVCDGVDLCPDVFDPGQVDLDGDGIGWACDPVESTTRSGITGAFLVRPAASRDALALEVEFACASAGCSYDTLSVDPRGAAAVRSDSTDPRDAWAATTYMEDPSITAHGHVLWSPQTPTQQVGELDVVTRTFTPRAGGVLRGQIAFDPGGESAVVVQPSSADAAQQLMLPQPDGSLMPIASAPGGFRIGSVTPHGALVAIASDGGPGATFALKSLRPGLTSPTDVVIDNTAVTAARSIGPVGPAASGPLCVHETGRTSLVELDGQGVVAAKLPLTSCPFQRLRIGERSVYFGSGDNATAAVVTHGAVVRTMFDDETGPFTAEIAGEDTVAVHVRGVADRVWAIAPDDTVVPIALDLTVLRVSAVGTTVHVVGVRGADLVLVRYRPTTGRQEVVLQHATVTDRVGLLTTREGAALAVVNRQGWIAPSGALAPTTMQFLGDTTSSDPLAAAAVRAGATVLLSERQVSSQLALYAYDEVGGTPRFTVLEPEPAAGRPALVMTDPRPSSPWFEYEGPTCYVGRVVVAGGTPQVERTACTAGADPGNTRFVGFDTYDRAIALVRGRLVAYSTDAVAVLSGGTALTEIDDPARTVVIGWSGRDAQGAFHCLVPAPGAAARCWTVPDPAALVTRDVSAANGGSLVEVLVTAAAPNLGITIVRSIGPGDRAPPM